LAAVRPAGPDDGRLVRLGAGRDHPGVRGDGYFWSGRLRPDGTGAGSNPASPSSAAPFLPHALLLLGAGHRERDRQGPPHRRLPCAPRHQRDRGPIQIHEVLLGEFLQVAGLHLGTASNSLFR